MTWLDAGGHLSCALSLAFPEPDLVHRHPPITQEADLYPPDIGLIQVFEDLVMLVRARAPVG